MLHYNLAIEETTFMLLLAIRIRGKHIDAAVAQLHFDENRLKQYIYRGRKRIDGFISLKIIKLHVIKIDLPILESTRSTN